MAPLADRQLQDSMSGSALGGLTDKRVQVPPGSSLFPAFDAYRSAINTPEAIAWFLKQGIVMSSVVIKPDSVTGNVTRDGVTRLETFTAGDGSGWWRISPRINAAAAALDVAGNGLPYLSDDSDILSRNTVLSWYGVKPPAHEGDLGRVRNELAASNWLALPGDTKARINQRILTARTVVDRIDERKNLSNQLSALLGNKPDNEALVLTGVQAQIGSTSSLAKAAATTASVSDVLKTHDLPLPKTVGELRNTIRWLNASLPPAPPLGNFAQLISTPWVPGALSEPDKQFLAGLSRVDPSHRNPSRDLLSGGFVDSTSPDELRSKAEHYLKLALYRSQPQARWEHIATGRQFRGQSAAGPSTLEVMRWAMAAIMLQIDPDAPGKPGVIAGYDIYQAANNGRSMAAVREDIEAHLKQKLGPDAKAAPLVAHLFLASAAPEFLIADSVSTLRMGTTEWADLRLGVAFAERQGGPGCSRAMSYQEVMALTRLDPRSPEEAAVLDNHGIAPLLDWGLMQGLYTKPADGAYTPQQYQQAASAFDAQRDQLLQALNAFKTPLPTRRSLAIEQLQKEFPDLDVKQLEAMRVYIADPNERRNMKLSEPRTRSLIETYMTGDLTTNRWMLLAPGEQPPQPAKPKSPYAADKGLSKQQQAAVDQNVKALNARIDKLANVQNLVSVEVDTYLDNLKQGLGTVTRRMIANLPLADRQALEFGNVELFALREQTDGVPTVELTPGQVEERRGRKGTVIRSEYNGVIRYFEVFPDKMLMVKRDDLPAKLTLGGTFESQPKTYGNWATTHTQVQNGASEPFDFKAYSSDSQPTPGTTSPGIIIDKLGDTLVAPTSAQNGTANSMPNSFGSARTDAIIDRIMQGNFVHHRDSVLTAARGELQLEQSREVLRRNDAILLSMIPFVGAIMDLVKGNWVEGTRGLLIDTVGALVGGAASAVGSLVKTTKVVAPFGAKAFRVLEKGVLVVSGFLNPLDGSADLLAAGAKGIFAVPKLLSKVPKPTLMTTLGAVEEKLRTYLGVSGGVKQLATTQRGSEQATASDGLYHGVNIKATQIDGLWYATDPKTGLPVGTPLDGFFSA
ncbi:hypothetical protein BFW87_24585 [Pseudomonas fluorescens]|uniref:Uncharacterized protein n=1 Tax=Pseudomonas fluorescens TaxID=294 RepID=A0A1T2Y3Z8_PSEFL|nr:hypothetical protein [Pseudomonas fluorescens]OPA86762.1 hypothetical protein BFW87_24585 [Pseudomonas fluorescens]